MKLATIFLICAYLGSVAKATQPLSISVHLPKGVATRMPVTGGVPIPENAAPAGTRFVLQDEQGNAVRLQTEVLARWNGGSVRWVLLDFQAEKLPAHLQPTADGCRHYLLSWGKEHLSQGKGGSAKEPAVVVTHREAGQLTLQAGSIDVSTVAVSTAEGTLVRISDRFDLVCALTDAQGRSCNAVVESAAVETSGKLRSAVALRGAFHGPAGNRLFQFRLRVSVYAGLSLIQIEPMILVDAEQGVVQKIRDLKLSFRPPHPLASVQMGGDPGWEGRLATVVRLFQYDDQHYRLQDLRGGQAPGWAKFADGQGSVGVAMGNFWQQWPKSIEASPAGLSFGLFPSFQEGDFGHMQPWYKYQYLFDGNCYQLRTGQARRWRLWLDLAGNPAAVAQMASVPPIPIADPAQAIATGQWGAIARAGIPAMAAYDPWAEHLFDAYCHSVKAQRDYGAMNWGDWFGERKVNWGNHEYDTTRQILLQFARTGDPRYFYVADAAARHSAEVDTVHHVNEELRSHFGVRSGYPARPGLVHQHTVGHVSGFYSKEILKKLFVEHGIGNSANPYLCLDPYNLGHIWTQGMARHYLLTGDPFLRETVELIGDNLAQLVEDREYQFMGHAHCGRTTGWSLLALSGAYDISHRPRYLRAMRRLVEDALAGQDPNCGGWLYPLPRGHCGCEKAKHTGMAGFITAVLVNGLSQYYFLTGDERVVRPIERAVTFLDNDTWREEWHDWRYTSCPATGPTHQPGVVILAHVNSVRIANNQQQLRILRAAWQAKFQRLATTSPADSMQGKVYSSTMVGCAEASGLLSGSDDSK